MEERYYDLIVSRIKEHRKYPGLEAILQDIAEDVYEHSKVVIGSITNEDVIKAYLDKVVSTSIVTVPKKLNFNTKSRYRAINVLPPEAVSLLNEKQAQKIVNTEENIDIDELEEALNIEENQLIEPAIISADEPIVDELKEELYPEIIESSNDLLTTENDFVTDSYSEQENILVEEAPLVQDNADNLFFEETVVEKNTESFVLQENINEEVVLTENTINSVDKTLVDKMINGISATNTDFTSSQEIEEEIEAPVLEETFAVEDEITDSFEEHEGEDLSLDLSDSSETLDIIDEDNTTIEEEISLNQDLEIITDLIEEPSADIIDELPEMDIAIDVDNSMLLEDESIEELNIVENTSLEEYSVDVEISPDIENEVDNQDFNADFSVPSFDCFAYEPDKISYDTSDTISYLDDANEKHPEKRIFEVCDLKYNHNLSVKEIANKLDFTEDVVLEILNEIIDIVKDS